MYIPKQRKSTFLEVSVKQIKKKHRKAIKPIFPAARKAAIRRKKGGQNPYLIELDAKRESLIEELEALSSASNTHSTWQRLTENLYEIANRAGANSKSSSKGLNGGAIAFHRRNPNREARAKRSKPSDNKNTAVAQLNRRFLKDPASVYREITEGSPLLSVPSILLPSRNITGESGTVTLSSPSRCFLQRRTTSISQRPSRYTS